MKNSIFKNAKIRLMIFRGGEGIFGIENNSTNYIIEAFPFSEKIELNEKEIELDIFPDGGKNINRFSNLKSNNYFPSVVAARFAKTNNLDDAIILNNFARACESSIAIIFIIKGSEIFTPPLSEGCVAGTMRRRFLERFELKNYTVAEKALSIKAF